MFGGDNSNCCFKRRVLLLGLLVVVVFVVSVQGQHEGTTTTSASAPPFYTCWDDASWAVVTNELSSVLSPDKQLIYDRFMNGCREAAGPQNAHRQCTQDEQFRLHMNMYQPRSVRNYTALGFRKTTTPDAVMDLLRHFWDTNRDRAVVEWTFPKPYHNNWDVPTEILKLDNASLPGGGPALQAAISNAARHRMEEWTGMKQAATSVYGIRIYRNQSILAPHVDRLPLVTSAIINVEQDVDEDWALEVYDHDGIAHNVTMKPGDMVLYESHSVLHGRPFPLNGKFFANVFIHFEPLGPIDAGPELLRNQAYFGGSNHLPPYLIEGSSWEPEWRDKNPNGWTLLQDARAAIYRGDVETLEYIAAVNPDALSATDDAGWAPVHEAARQGDLNCLRVLARHGVDLNKPCRVTGMTTPMSVAVHFHGPNSPAVQLLAELGGILPRTANDYNTNAGEGEDDEYEEDEEDEDEL